MRWAGRLAARARAVIEAGLVAAWQGGVAVSTLELPGQRATSGQLVRLTARPECLAGREALLADVDARLSADDAAGLRTVVLCGLGGVLKTSLAVGYARRHLAEVGWRGSGVRPPSPG